MRTKVNMAGSTGGFTLAEVVVALAIACLVFSGIIYGYSFTANCAQWSTYSLAAQSLAQQGVEQARAAKWDPRAWPPVDELGTTNLVQQELLDVPTAAGASVWATNYITVRDLSQSPPIRELRADCVWMLDSRTAQNCGPFTNTLVTLRTADQ
jgi:prepilin-type N-terminal cleavage/methylation domain-containing protein